MIKESHIEISGAGSTKQWIHFLHWPGINANILGRSTDKEEWSMYREYMGGNIRWEP